MIGIVEEGGSLDVAVNPAVGSGIAGEGHVDEADEALGDFGSELYFLAMCERLFEPGAERRAWWGRGDLFAEEAMHPGEAEADLRYIVLGIFFRIEGGAGNGEGDEHAGILQTFADEL